MHSKTKRILKWSLLLSKVQCYQLPGKMKQNLHQGNHYLFKCQTDLLLQTVQCNKDNYITSLTPLVLQVKEHHQTKNYKRQ